MRLNYESYIPGYCSTTGRNRIALINYMEKSEELDEFGISKYVMRKKEILIDELYKQYGEQLELLEKQQAKIHELNIVHKDDLEIIEKLKQICENEPYSQIYKLTERVMELETLLEAEKRTTIKQKIKEIINKLINHE
jgi:hypothetical protein